MENRPGPEQSCRMITASNIQYELAACFLNRSIALCRRAGFRSFLLRGDSGFTQTVQRNGFSALRRNSSRLSAPDPIAVCPTSCARGSLPPPPPPAPPRLKQNNQLCNGYLLVPAVAYLEETIVHNAT